MKPKLLLFFLNLLSPDLLSGGFLELLSQWMLLDIESIVESYPQKNVCIVYEDLCRVLLTLGPTFML